MTNPEYERRLQEAIDDPSLFVIDGCGLGFTTVDKRVLYSLDEQSRQMAIAHLKRNLAEFTTRHLRQRTEPEDR